MTQTESLFFGIDFKLSFTGHPRSSWTSNPEIDIPYSDLQRLSKSPCPAKGSIAEFN